MEQEIKVEVVRPELSREEAIKRENEIKQALIN